MDIIELDNGTIIFPADGSTWTHGIYFDPNAPARSFYHMRKPDEIGDLVKANADRRRPFYTSERGIDMFNAYAPGDIYPNLTAYTVPLISSYKVIFLELDAADNDTRHKEKHLPMDATPSDILHEMKVFFLEEQEEITPRALINLLEIERTFERRID